VLVGGFGSPACRDCASPRERSHSARLPSRGPRRRPLVWASGAPWIWPGPPGDARYASRSAALKYGWNAHNYLGLADAWSLRGDETDDQLLNYFEAPPPARNDAEARALWLEFVRANQGPLNPDCVKPAITPAARFIRHRDR
jgi:hypothetical protein